MLLHCCLLLLLSVIVSIQSCIEKSFDPSFTVCFCNATVCDSIGPAEVALAPPGKAVLFYSSKSGRRFQRSVILSLTNFSESSISVVIDSSIKFQTIHGFGGAFSDSTCYNIAQLPKAVQHRLLEDYFGPTGIEYSLGRVPIASTDYSLHQYSYDDVSGDIGLYNFSLTQDDYLYKIPFIQQAKALSGNKFKLFSSPWSAPGWMKDNGNMSYGGRLLDKYRTLFANYFVRFFEENEKHGILFWATTVINAPQMASPKWKWPSMNFTAVDERNFVRDFLGPTLKENNATRNIAIIGLDDVTYKMDEWMNTVLSDKAAATYYGGFGTHCYYNSKKDLYSFTEILSKVHRQYTWARDEIFENETIRD